MSTSDDSRAPDPVRPVTFVAGGRPGSLDGQFIDNSSSEYSQFVDPVNPSGYDAKNEAQGARDARAGTDAMTKRTVIVVFAVAFVAVNIMLLRSLATSPDAWPQANFPAAALQYGFSVVTSTLVFGVAGSVLAMACLAALPFVKRKLGRS